MPFYLPALWWLLEVYGIEGAAAAWVARVAVDTLFLFGMARRFLPTRAPIIRRMAQITGAALLALSLAALPMGIAVKGLFLLLTLLAFVVAAWFLILVSEERILVQNRLKIVCSSIGVLPKKAYRAFRK